MSKVQEFKLYGIVGYPLGHTLSPAMQEAAFQHLGIKAFYLVLELAPRPFLKAMKELSAWIVEGFNVTVPYKETVMPYLDQVTKEAKQIGAVNTVWRKGGKWQGTNTDAYGFSCALKKKAGFSARGKCALVLGAGGSSRSVLYALAGENVKTLYLANRHIDRAQRLAQKFKKIFPKVEFLIKKLTDQNLKECLDQVDLVVNATSVGLKRKDKSLIHPKIMPLASKGKKILFFDLIYRPEETALLKLAKKKGHRTLNGQAMLAYQGAKSFEYWTGKKAPEEVMNKILQEALKKESGKS